MEIMTILQTELKTERLCLTRPYITDAEAMFNSLRDRKIFRYNTWRRHDSPVETLAFVNNLVARYENGDAEWVIRRKDDDEAMGIICLRDFPFENNCAEIGFWLGSRFHGHGFGSEVVKKIVDFGFTENHLSKIVAFCHPKNAASLKILIKNGFFVEREEKNEFHGEDFEETPILLKLSVFN
ncbi:MAG: GNAT family N-acetyltransferase [Clostridiales bacterium]|nr:GNAT family N-acetyltransferase [Clostridiales bacterium]